MRKIILGIFIVLSLTTSAFAVCGDVTGDEQVRATDALVVLKEAAGIATGQCIESGLVVRNKVAFVNLLYCGGAPFASVMTWSEHRPTSWTDWSGNGWADTGYWSVNDDYIGGRMDFSLGGCGDVYIDLDSQGLRYPMPLEEGLVAIALQYDEYTQNVYVNFYLDGFACSPSECDALMTYGEPIQFSLGRVEGVSGQ